MSNGKIITGDCLAVMAQMPPESSSSEASPQVI